MAIHDVLARIYGLDKTASEQETELDLDTMSAVDFLAGIESGEIVYVDGDEPEAEKTAGDEGELDLDNMSATQLLQGLESGEIVFDDGSDPEAEKTAGFDLDSLTQEQLESMSAEELIELANSLDEDPGEQEKVAAEQQYWLDAGALMARGYASELEKLSSEQMPDELEIDMSKITGADLVELMEHYEFVEDDEPQVEKTAGGLGSLLKFKGARKAFKGSRKAGETAEEALKARKSAAKDAAKAAGKGDDKAVVDAFKRGRDAHKAGKAAKKEARKLRRKGYKKAGQSAAVYGGGLAAAGGLAAGTKAALD